MKLFKKYIKESEYTYVHAIIKTIDGLVDLVILPFGYTSSVYKTYCRIDLRRD